MWPQGLTGSLVYGSVSKVCLITHRLHPGRVRHFQTTRTVNHCLRNTADKQDVCVMDQSEVARLPLGYIFLAQHSQTRGSVQTSHYMLHVLLFLTDSIRVFKCIISLLDCTGDCISLSAITSAKGVKGKLTTIQGLPVFIQSFYLVKKERRSSMSKVQSLIMIYILIS